MTKTHHKWPRHTNISRDQRGICIPSEAGTEKRFKSLSLLLAWAPGQDCPDLEPRNIAALYK